MVESDCSSTWLDNVNEFSENLSIAIKKSSDETKKDKEKKKDFIRLTKNGLSC